MTKLTLVRASQPTTYMGQQLHAADAHDRHAKVEDARVDHRRARIDSFFGPPDKMMPTPAAAWQSLPPAWCAEQSRVHRQFAQPARDQLGVLQTKMRATLTV